jgi:hypothetical protein
LSLDPLQIEFPDRRAFFDALTGSGHLLYMAGAKTKIVIEDAEASHHD